MFPTEDSLYLLTDAAMALKVDPETLDTTDEVRTKSCQKEPDCNQNGKKRQKYQILPKLSKCLDIFEYILKVDPETLDTTDEVRTKSCQKEPDCNQNCKKH